MAGESTKMFISQWLNNTTPKQLGAMAEAGESLVDKLKPYGFAVRLAKLRNHDFYMAPDELIGWMYGEFPEHAMVANSNRAWFNQNIDELIQYIDTI